MQSCRSSISLIVQGSVTYQKKKVQGSVLWVTSSEFCNRGRLHGGLLASVCGESSLAIAAPHDPDGGVLISGTILPPIYISCPQLQM